ncbi:MAG: AAA family ATPase, partial [Victivallales bacterium]|nr:AAA family ATPase [Victivallales bacterium]
MEDIDIQQLYDNYHRKIAKISLGFKRYLYSKINWNARMIGIKGARGVGKTTLLLQHILDNYKDLDQTLYVSLDDLWFTTHKLMDLVDWADRHGITRLYLDEVHRYREWSETLKNIYDSYPDMGIVYTSSSLLAMDNAKVDLSRRQTLYMLYGMSFREYLAFENAVDISPLSMDELLHDHVRYAMQMMKDIKIAPVFESYLDYGYYPFYREVGDDFHMRLREVLSVVMDT